MWPRRVIATLALCSTDVLASVLGQGFLHCQITLMFLKFYAVFLPNICDVDLDGDIMETVQSEAVTILQFGASAVDGYIED